MSYLYLNSSNKILTRLSLDRFIQVTENTNNKLSLDTLYQVTENMINKLSLSELIQVTEKNEQ